MYSLNEEIEKRIQSNYWSQEIAEKVISEKSRRTKRKLTVTGSLFIGLFMFIVIGLNVYQTKPESASWSENFMSAIIESINIAIPEDVDEFISYSFNGK